MAFQILKPEITSITKGTWDKIKISWFFWLFFTFTFLGAVLLIMKGLADKQDPVELLFIMIPTFFIIIVSTYIAIVSSTIRTSFWKQFAEINGWYYRDYGAERIRN
jgi:uncharacterized membrane protein